MSNVVVPTVAALAAQAPDKPALLKADTLGRLITAANIQTVTTLAAPIAAGQTTWNVVDSSSFFPGMIVGLTPASTAVQGCGGMTVLRVPDKHTIVVFSICAGQTYAIGDFVIGTPAVSVSGNVAVNNLPATQNVAITSPNPVPISGSVDVSGSAHFLPAGYASHSGNNVDYTPTFFGRLRMSVDAERSFDWFQDVDQQGSAGLTVDVSAPGAGLSYVVTNIAVHFLNTGAAASKQTGRAWAGAVGTGVHFASWLAAAGSNLADHVYWTGRFRIGNNTAMHFVIDAGAAGNFTSFSWGGYFEG